MIKYINDGEINELKRGFFNSLALKRIKKLDLKNSIENIADLNSAMKILNSLAALKFPSYESYFCINMFKYFRHNKYFDNKTYDEMLKIFPNIWSEEIEEEGTLEYGDYSSERFDFIDKFIEKLAIEKNIEIVSESYGDIFSGDEDYIDQDIFGDIREMLKSCLDSAEDFSSFTAQELNEKYFEYFQDDATCYVFLEYEMSDFEINLLSDTFFDSDSGVASEIYTDKGNTYITISDYQVYEGFGLEFLIFLYLIFKSKN